PSELYDLRTLGNLKVPSSPPPPPPPPPSPSLPFPFRSLFFSFLPSHLFLFPSLTSSLPHFLPSFFPFILPPTFHPSFLPSFHPFIHSFHHFPFLFSALIHRRSTTTGSRFSRLKLANYSSLNLMYVR